jgi:hypothetical protein
MAYLIGRRGTARETYPEANAGGGSGSAIVPLTRYRFIDGGTVQAGLNGSVAEPFKTIAEFMASRSNASVADATAAYVGILTPALNGYAENVVFPPYASTELRANNLSFADGSAIAGTVSIPNVGGAHAAAEAVFVLHNIFATGALTYTDDGGAPTSLLILSGDEAYAASSLFASIDTHTSAHLTEVTLVNVGVTGNVNCGVGSANASLEAASSSFSSSAITAKSAGFQDCGFSDGTVFTVSGGGSNLVFTGCAFEGDTAPSLVGSSLGAIAVFDGPSWRSFLEASGAIGANMVVLVVGGYGGGPVQGIPIGDVSATLSLDGTGAGGTWATGGNVYFQNTAITANRTIQFLKGGGEQVGDTMRVVRTVVDASGDHLTFEDDTGATIGTLAAANRGYFEVRYNGTHWVMTGGGGGLT